MTRRYARRGWNIEKRCFESQGIYTFSIYPGDGEHFTVTRDGVAKTVKVEGDNEFAYKILKTKIKARGGAEGLFKFIDDALFNGFMKCCAWQILDGVIDYMRPAV